jgi:hypothetical protein
VGVSCSHRQARLFIPFKKLLQASPMNLIDFSPFFFFNTQDRNALWSIERFRDVTSTTDSTPKGGEFAGSHPSGRVLRTQNLRKVQPQKYCYIANQRRSKKIKGFWVADKNSRNSHQGDDKARDS